MDILEKASQVKTVELDTRLLKLNEQGRIEVSINSDFRNAVSQLFNALLSQQAHPTPKFSNNEKLQNEVRKVFLEQSNQLIHRTKTDLNSQEVCFLHFAIIKAVLQLGREALTVYIEQRKDRVNELKWHGSSELLKVQDHLSWLHKNSEHVLYRVLKLVFKELQRVESKYLRNAWKTLGQLDLSSAHVLLNPALISPNLKSSSFQIEHYYLWETVDNKFSSLNSKLEQLLSNSLKNLPCLPLNAQIFSETETSAQNKQNRIQNRTTVCREYLGKPISLSPVIRENFCWFDDPDSVEQLFHPEVQREHFNLIRKESGLKEACKYLLHAKKRWAVLRKFSRLLDKESLLKACIASNKTYEIWPQAINRQVDCLKLYQYLSGSISLTALQKSLPRTVELKPKELTLLKDTAKSVNEEYKNEHWLNSLQALQKTAKFRQQIKCFHLAYSVFNRISLLEKKDDIERSRISGRLYTLHATEELMQNQNDVAHQSVLVMSFNGIAELKRSLKEKNSDSDNYIEENLYSPLRKIITDCSSKLETLNDNNLVLTFQEYEKIPEHWYALSYVCHLSHKFLDASTEFNKLNIRAGLPEITCGIGLAYSSNNENPFNPKRDSTHATAKLLANSLINEVPKFVYENFNAHIQSSFSNSDEQEKSSRLYSVYNKNGVLLSPGAFKKLSSEMNLQKINTQIFEKQLFIYSGSWIADQKRKEIWIREEKIESSPTTENVILHEEMPAYYELVRNKDLIHDTKRALTNQLKKIA